MYHPAEKNPVKLFLLLRFFFPPLPLRLLLLLLLGSQELRYLRAYVPLLSLRKYRE